RARARRAAGGPGDLPAPAVPGAATRPPLVAWAERRLLRDAQRGGGVRPARRRPRDDAPQPRPRGVRRAVLRRLTLMGEILEQVRAREHADGLAVAGDDDGIRSPGSCREHVVAPLIGVD